MALHLYNTLTKQKEVFTPLDPARVTMYACGPTVHNYIHIGNGRMAVAFDVLYRLLQTLYPQVVFVRNITDIEDKIITAAREQDTTPQALTQHYAQQFIQDVENINCLLPDHQPLATEYVPQMVTMIATLLDNGHAYAAMGHVLFDVTSYDDYGRLSGRSRDEQIAGSRVEVAPYKRDPGDFVLWKPSTDDQSGWDSPWGRGRPGWHIECSAMSNALLGPNFDIHGGGLDLIFPHHENEIAQSCCAHPGSGFARYWLHNGFLQINNEKMSKSLNNFFTVHELLEQYPGEAIRLALLGAHYRQPLDFTNNLLDDARKTLDRWYRVLEKAPDQLATMPTLEFTTALHDDLNTPRAIAELHRLANEINKSTVDMSTLHGAFRAGAAALGLLTQDVASWFKGGDDDHAAIEQLIADRLAARGRRDFAASDAIRQQLSGMGITLDDGPGGTTWRKA